MLQLPIDDYELTLGEEMSLPDGPWRLDKPHWKARKNLMWVRVPGLAEYRVSEGRHVHVRPLDPQATERELQHFLLATPLAALAFQRGELPLHAAALVPPSGRGALLLCAHSGTGKSTTAAALCQRGWRLLNDDISRIGMNSEGIIQVWPGVQQIRLWQDSCTLLGLPHETLALSMGLKKKYLYQPEGCAQPQPLLGIVELLRPRKAPLPGQEPTQDHQPVGGSEAIALLKRHTFRPPLIAGLDAAINHFRLSAAIVKQVPLFSQWLAHELTPQQIAERLEAQWQ